MSLPILSVFSICNAFNWAIKNVLSLTRCVNEYDFLLQDARGPESTCSGGTYEVVRISCLNTCVANIHLHIFKTVPKINRIYSFILLFIVIYSDQLLFRIERKRKRLTGFDGHLRRLAITLTCQSLMSKFLLPVEVQTLIWEPSDCYPTFIYEHEEEGGVYRGQGNLRLSTP